MTEGTLEVPSDLSDFESVDVAEYDSHLSVPWCVVCGYTIGGCVCTDYSETEDTIWDNHEAGNHTLCHPHAACQ